MHRHGKAYGHVASGSEPVTAGSSVHLEMMMRGMPVNTDWNLTTETRGERKRELAERARLGR